MASVYPGALDSLDTTWANTDATDNVHPAHHSDLADAVNKIEAELGIEPSGSFATLLARLNARITCRKTADQSVANATLVNITDMALPVATTGIDYYFKFVQPVTAAALATGWRVAVTVPALAAGGYVAYNVWGPVASTEATTAAPTLAQVHQWGVGTASGDAVLGFQVPANSLPYVIKIEGILSNPSATGNIQLQAASEAAATSVWKRGGWGEVYIA